MSQYLNLRVPVPTGDRMKPHAAAMGWSPNGFAEHCISIICDMIEDPSKRTIPDVVAMLDAREAATRRPLPKTRRLPGPKPTLRKTAPRRPTAQAQPR